MEMVSFGPLRVIGSEDITVDATAGGKAFTAATYITGTGVSVQQARAAYVTVHSEELRWNIDPAVTVTASTNGHVAAAGKALWIWGFTQLQNFRAIRTGGSSAAIHVTYFA